MSKHVAIIGGGVVGMATAWFCQQQGHQVTVIDRKPSQRDGCSFGNAGMLVPSHVIPLAAPGMIAMGLKWMWNPESPFYIRPRASMDLVRWMWQFKKSCTQQHVQRSAPLLRDLHLRSRELYQQLQTELPDGFGLKTRGLLMLCKTAAGLDEEAKTAAKAESLGVPAQVLDAEATSKLDPNVQMDIRGSVFYPKDCHLSPNRLMRAIESELENNGCRFCWETESLGFTKSGGRIENVVTSAGEIDADEFVVCGGVWSTMLGHDLGVALPMQAGKGYSVTIDQPAELPELCSLLHEARVAVTPMGSSLRVGGTMEIAGIDQSISQSRVRGILQSVPKYFPAFKASDFEGQPVWSGLRPCSPDGLPYLGRTAKWSNLVVSTGHAMMGISLAMVSAEIVANLLSHQTPEIEGLRMLSPDRYAR
ncbi:FAD-dependent oxidoreductase [Planctomycetes bacterium K23_9]|uniref:D-amino acid dehydrogenase small subunit n=1 Tax=Stieleria marina TaxID=1930275 RepID=A0A517P0E2_9BACT|nr:D-amino acid dehydrogenase small subunit [Planctomycetes bacterium K23_9]